MGTEALWVPALISAVGAGASYYNTQNTAKKQDRALADQLMQQRVRQGEADRVVNETLEDVRGSNAESERAAAMDQYVQQLRRGQGAAVGALGGVGAASDRFGADAAGAAGDISQYGMGTADIFSRIDAPLMQRQNEGIQFGRTGSDLAMIGALSDSDRTMGEMRMRGIRRNPWVDAFSQAAQSYGSAASGGGGG